MVIDALSGSIASVTNVILITVIVLLLFSIIGVNLYEGRFHACQGDVYDSWSRDQRDFLTSPPDSYSQFGAIQIGYLNDTHCDNENWWAQRRKDARETSTREVTSKMLCECMGADWGDAVAPRFNFDNVVYAFLLLFEITTTEGYVCSVVVICDMFH